MVTEQALPKGSSTLHARRYLLQLTITAQNYASSPSLRKAAKTVSAGHQVRYPSRTSTRFAIRNKGSLVGSTQDWAHRFKNPCCSDSILRFFVSLKSASKTHMRTDTDKQATRSCPYPLHSFSPVLPHRREELIAFRTAHRPIRERVQSFVLLTHITHIDRSPCPSTTCTGGQVGTWSLRFGSRAFFGILLAGLRGCLGMGGFATAGRTMTVSS